MDAEARPEDHPDDNTGDETVAMLAVRVAVLNEDGAQRTSGPRSSQPPSRSRSLAGAYPVPGAPARALAWCVAGGWHLKSTLRTPGSTTVIMQIDLLFR